MIEFSGAGVRTDDGRTLLHPLTLTLAERRISVIGANGSGKSTLLRLVNGLLVPTTGSVRVLGRDTQSEGRAVRRSVGFVFTDPFSQLVMPTGREDVELSLRSRKTAAADRRARGEAVLRRFGVDHLADRSIYDLSGGERQILALAVVLAVEPRVLVADEPTTLLDLRNDARVRELIAGLDQQVVFTTHNLDFALESDRTLVVDDGRIVFDGPPAEAVAHYRRLATTGTGRT
ncbi:energy-coupling factor ABC transporter ATP-binding protein [Arthrobacter agilis]|uniref:energy-coupling factor ABC transporter ATP-binding protein n=1 Tax=Arthrobacter agilis TaxID=37921 RepID=UPI0027809DB0|nr:ABC transporter ATP-binding protein [Arthrobacter agilis]MDQ0734621.1 biotin transport system ATP-binding protein [Arthrobacter agilis]